MESGNKINNNQTMTVKRLHWILSAAIKDGHGDLPVKFSVSEEPDDGDIVESIYNVSDWRLVTGKEGTLFLEKSGKLWYNQSIMNRPEIQGRECFCYDIRRTDSSI